MIDKPKSKYPTARDLIDEVEDVPAMYELATRVERVLALHTERHIDNMTPLPCKHCGEWWPCPTVRILNGEEG